jgi:cellulose synthase/poly-beta-1,6-N-acetylglucosamine synthase-like glycosyltransferase
VGDQRPGTVIADRPPPVSVRSILVPAVSLRQELVLRALVLVTAAACAWFWLWWLASGHGVTWASPLGDISTVLLAWVFSMPIYFLFFASRMTRPDPRVPLPDVRVAMIVTKAPSEPWTVVRTTLEAMLTQDYPAPYDVWLADERPEGETLDWCARHGVHVSTRFGVEDYHRATWPRRTKSKEGNLAYFYDTVGYSDYDVVVQLDCDHVPTSSYLTAMVRPFAAAAVGYVCAPSICDSNESEGWTVRGRLYREATLHGPMQAGANDGYAPVCIGSHYAVRTAALRDVGGIGPELAEDYSTTLWLQSGGWDGVFALDAEAHGAGPASVDEMLTQESQWARSLGTVLTKWMPGRFGSVPWRGRLRMGFSLFFYLVMGVMLTVASLLPVLGVLVRRSWGNSSLLAFYAHMWAYSLLVLVTAAYVRHLRVFRPRDAKLWSWEAVLFQLARWPWTFGCFLQGMYFGWRSRTRAFKVTPKGTAEESLLGARWLVPMFVLGALPAWAVVLTPPHDLVLGPALLCIVECATYLVALLAIVVLHLRRNPDPRSDRRAAPLDGAAQTRYPVTAGVSLVALASVVTMTALVVRVVHGLI